jgi:hypothetical protein
MGCTCARSWADLGLNLALYIGSCRSNTKIFRVVSVFRSAFFFFFACMYTYNRDQLFFTPPACVPHSVSWHVPIIEPDPCISALPPSRVTHARMHAHPHGFNLRPQTKQSDDGPSSILFFPPVWWNVPSSILGSPSQKQSAYVTKKKNQSFLQFACGHARLGSALSVAWKGALHRRPARFQWHSWGGRPPWLRTAMATCSAELLLLVPWRGAGVSLDLSLSLPQPAGGSNEDAPPVYCRGWLVRVRCRRRPACFCLAIATPSRPWRRCGGQFQLVLRCRLTARRCWEATDWSRPACLLAAPTGLLIIGSVVVPIIGRNRLQLASLRLSAAHDSTPPLARGWRLQVTATSCSALP